MIMKTLCRNFASAGLLAALALTPTMVLRAQPAPAATVPLPAGYTARPAPEAPALARFNLDFAGGEPGELVDAISNAAGKPLNAVIPDELRRLRLPALRLREVTAPELFRALERAGMNAGNSQSGYQVLPMGGVPGNNHPAFGFVTADNPPRDGSIWTFYGQAPRAAADQPEGYPCRFFQLGPYLDAGYKVEDILTSVEIGWKMMGQKPVPELKFHPETKLLIAVGPPAALSMIDDALSQLKRPSAPPKAAPGAPLPGR